MLMLEMRPILPWENKWYQLIGIIYIASDP